MRVVFQNANSAWLQSSCKPRKFYGSLKTRAISSQATRDILLLKNSNIESNPLDFYRAKIAQRLGAITGVPIETVFAAFEQPRIASHADICVPLPRLGLKGKSPKELSREISSRFQCCNDIQSVACAGIYLNFTLNRTGFTRHVLGIIDRLGEAYGRGSSGVGKTAIVDFSSPNIAKPFHAGHLRSTLLGNFIRNVLQEHGWKVVSVNYLGDWGKQYGLLAVGYERYGSEEALEKDAISHLFQVYVSINRDAESDPEINDRARAYFKRMEEGDPAVLELWRRLCNLSIEKYKQIYDRLGIKFDIYSGESQVMQETRNVTELLGNRNMLVEHAGCKVVDLSVHDLNHATIQKSDGTSLYITRDLGAVLQRYGMYQFDAMYYVAGSAQDLHFKQLFKILELINHPAAGKCNHINFGLVEGMSTRRGSVVFLEDLLNETQQHVLATMRRNGQKYTQIQDPLKVADTIAQSAIIIQDMSSKRIKDYKFAWERMFCLEGDTGPYLQYTHARLCSIERRFKSMSSASIDDVDLDLLDDPIVPKIIMLLAQYPDVVKSLATNGFEPSTLVTYLFKLCHAASTALETIWVLNQEQARQHARLFLYSSIRAVLHRGLLLLGLKPLEKM